MTSQRWITSQGIPLSLTSTSTYSPLCSILIRSAVRPLQATQWSWRDNVRWWVGGGGHEEHQGGCWTELDIVPSVLTAVSPSLSWILISAPASTSFWTHFLWLCCGLVCVRGGTDNPQMFHYTVSDKQLAKLQYSTMLRFSYHNAQILVMSCSHSSIANCLTDTHTTYMYHIHNHHSLQWLSHYMYTTSTSSGSCLPISSSQVERSDANLVLNVDTCPLPEEVPHAVRCTSAEGSSKRDCERGDIIGPTCLGSSWTCPGTVSKSWD